MQLIIMHYSDRLLIMRLQITHLSVIILGLLDILYSDL